MKKLNLIKRLWTDSHEKQSPQRFGRYAAMLIMLLTLGVGQMWASTRTIYFDTGGNSFKNGATYLRVYTWSTEATHTTLTLVSGTLYSANVPDNNANCIFYSATSEANDWSSKTGQTLDQNSYASSGNLFTVSSVDSNGDIKGSWSTYSGGGSSFSVVYNGNGNTSGSVPTDENSYESGDDVTVLGLNTLVKTNYVFAGWSTANDGTGTYYAPGATFSITAATTLYAIWVDEGVLEGTYVMAYCGELTGWNQSTYKFTDISGTQQASVTISGSTEVVDDTYKTGAVTLDPNITYYNQGHSGWSSGLDCAIQAGYLYVVRDSKSSSYFTQKDQSGSDYLYEVSQQNSTTPATRTVTTTLGSSSFVTGTSTLSVTTTGSNVPGKSVIGYNNNLLYFLDNGSSWSLVTLSAGNLDVSSLTAGHYELVTVLYDGFIYVKADKDDFNVYDTWAMYSGDTKIADFTTTDGVHYSITDLVINNENNANTNYRSSCNVNPAQAGALSLLVNEASARALTFDNGRIAWQDGNGTFNIYIDNNGGWKIYASKTAGVEEWYWIAGNGAQTGSEDVTKQVFEETATAGVYTLTRTIPQDQTFHFGNTIKGYGPNSTARGGNTSVSVTPTSSDIGLEEYGSVYWFQFNSAEQPVVMTLNTNTNPYTISFSNPVYTITYQDQGGSAYSGSNGSALPTSHTYGTATDLVNGTKDGYAFRGWFTTSACTGDAVTSLGATAYSNDITLYAKWGENPSLTGLVLSTSLVTTGNTFTATPTIDAGDGRTTIVCWEVQTAAGVKLDPQPSISPEEGNAVTITAPAAPGSYKVVATLKEGTECEGTVLNSLQRSFTVEGSYTVTITNGSGSSSVGEETTATATANAAAAGMKFDHWNVTGTITEYTSGSATTSSITFRASSNIELTAVYAEDYSTGWYLATDAFDAGSWEAEKTEFLKRTGETAGSIAYVSYDLNRAGSYPTNNQFRFKIQDSNTYSTYGDDKAGTMTYGNCTDWSLVDASSKDVTKVNVNVTGTYTFKLDYANMKISVIYPVVNQLQVYTTTGSDEATIVQDYNWTQTAGVYSQKLELEEATTYTFKVVKNSVHYGNSTTLSASNKSATLTTGGGNISLTTTSAGTYTISYNPTTDQVSVSLNDESLTTVAVEYGWGGLTKNVSVGAFTYPTITATVPEGMNFDSWTHTGTVTYGSSSTSTSTTITSATSGAKVTATFNSEKIIYFDNSASNWNDENGIWVYLFSSTDGVWWDEEINGGVHPQHNILEANRMTRIGTSDIYYYKYSTNTTIAGVAFTKADQRNYYSFNGTSAAWLTSFNTCTPCYIASAEYTSKNSTGYHSTGYWKKYGTTDPGVSLWIYYNSQWHENKFTNTDPTSFIYTTSETLTSAASDYAYHVERCNGEYLIRSGYDGHIAPSDSDYPRELTPKGSKPDGKITTTSAGEYNFTLDLSGDHIYMYTEYPLNVGDYRVVLNNGTKNHPSGKIIRAKTESVSDTVSFFINKDATNTLHVDTCYSTDPLAWRTIADVPASQLSLDKKPYTGTTGVYNFLITHSRYKDVSLDSITDEKKVYTGNYYIRTDAAEGKWKTYITTPDNKIQHSAKSLNTEAQFDYYFTKWVLQDANVQFTIANDYSPCISDTLYGDTYTGGADESHQTLLADANVRYMWNSGTNTISRAYLDGATAVGSQFIVLHSSDGKLFSSSATTLEHGDALTDIVFTDTKNWIYQADVKALPNAVATLTAEYNDNDINIISGGKEQKLFGGDSEDDETLYPLRMVYDFKTNILVSAWIAESDQALGATNLALDADLMIVRKLQEPAAQITFTTGSLSDVKTIYGALRFDYDDMVTHLSSWTGNYGKLLYDVSFPFDVNVKDIFGVGNMDDHWVVQKYNGARRAKEGWFMESKPFWETLTEDSVMHAYEGYTVIIDRPSFNSSTSVVWQNKLPGSSVYLYFPSASVDSKTISRGDVTIHLDSLNCKKDQTFEHPETHQILNHKFTDSNWRMLGVPLLSDTTGNFSSLFKSSVDYTAENPFGYLYTWSTVDNSYSITSTSDFTFKAMHSYMVQFAGDVTFKGSYVHKAPSRIVAAKRTEDERHYTVKLQMANANIDDVTSQTYVELRENACDTFALNEDVYMVRSSNIADLYTFAGAYDVAANVLSVGNHVVPVGMDVKQAGMYTFSMPSDFSGTVTLVDTQAGTRTNLSLNSYEIYLNRGAINDRFYLDIDIQEVITSVENVEGSNAINDGGAHKFLQNGQMYILKNGVIYDAKGNRVK